MPVKFLPGTERMLLAGLVAGAQQSLVAAATEAMVEAEQHAAPFQDTGQLHTNIHVVYPGQADEGTGAVRSSGLSAKGNEALVIMKTHRDPDGDSPRDRGDYGWYQENGPASSAEPNGRHHLATAANAIRGKYPSVTVGPVVSVTSLGGE
ncbi:MAG: hypothetical protein WC565_09325 [Parcubacteria group bacterium]